MQHGCNMVGAFCSMGRMPKRPDIPIVVDPDVTVVAAPGHVRVTGQPATVSAGASVVALSARISRRMVRVGRRFLEAAFMDEAAAKAHLADIEDDVRLAMAWTKRAGRARKAPGEGVGAQRLLLQRQGLSAKQIANQKGKAVSPKTVSQSLYRERKKSRQ